MYWFRFSACVKLFISGLANLVLGWTTSLPLFAQSLTFFTVKQCGNQTGAIHLPCRCSLILWSFLCTGAKFWEAVSDEHGIERDEECTDLIVVNWDRYCIPRTVLVYFEGTNDADWAYPSLLQWDPFEQKHSSCNTVDWGMSQNELSRSRSRWVMINLRKYCQFTGRLENVFSIKRVELESLVSVLKECVYAQTSPMYSLPLTGTFSRLASCFTCHRLPPCYCSSLLDGPKVPPSDPHGWWDVSSPKLTLLPFSAT